MLTRRSFVARLAAIVSGFAVTLHLKPKPYTPAWTLDDLQFGIDTAEWLRRGAVNEIVMSFADRRYLLELCMREKAPWLMARMFDGKLWLGEIEIVARRDETPGEMWLGHVPPPQDTGVVAYDASLNLLVERTDRQPFSCCYRPALRDFRRRTDAGRLLAPFV